MNELREIEENEDGYRKCIINVVATTDPPEVRDVLTEEEWEKALQDAVDRTWG